MLGTIISIIILAACAAVFILNLRSSVKKFKSGGCSGCNTCPAASQCDKKVENDK